MGLCSKVTAAKLAKASASKLEVAGSAGTTPTDPMGAKSTGPDKSFAEVLANLPEPMQLLLASLEDYTFSLGDDVQRKELRLYAAFKRLKNFVTVVLHRKNCLLLYLHVDPATALRVLPTARDVTSIGHWGTGNLEVPITSQADLDAVKPFINAAYEGRG
jgi:predicted transport protein